MSLRREKEEMIQHTALDHLFFSLGGVNPRSHHGMKMPSEQQEKSGKGQQRSGS
jgi:hypothetical protein